LSAVAFRSSQSVTNGTAGTSVTVTKPVGIVDTGSNPGRDYLVAAIAATGAPTFTPPADWTLVETVVDAGNAVTMKVYRKLADAEGADWTWTLGSSQRNWGWVGAYTGVDPDDPIYDPSFANTDLTLTTSTTLSAFNGVLQAGALVYAAAAVRTASGSATTWATTMSTLGLSERLDTSTNAGAGTDIAGTVGDALSVDTYALTEQGTVVASQAQTAGVLAIVSLRPYFTPFGGDVGDLGLMVEAAFGADPDGDSRDWTWTDITSLVQQEPGLEFSCGRASVRSTAEPAGLSGTLLNLSGEFTHPEGAYYENFRRNLPLRVRLTGFGHSDHHRATVFLSAARPRWDPSLNFSVVDFIASGRLRQLQQGDRLKSAGYRAISALSPLDYWPIEDGSDAAAAANAVANGHPGPRGLNFSSDTSFAGSESLAVLAGGASAKVRPYANTGSWTVGSAIKIPTEPAGNTVLLRLDGAGNAPRWQLLYLPASNEFTVRAYDSEGTQLFTNSFAVTPAEVFGVALGLVLSATQDGADIDYEATLVTSASGSTSMTGTLASRSVGVLRKMSVPSSAGTTGATYGHWIVSSSVIDPVDALQVVIGGRAGDWPWERFDRLCTEEGVPHTYDGSANTDLTMGPQAVGTLYDLIRECETVEGCLLNDVGSSEGETGLLWFPARDDRDNAAATMTLDVSAGQVASGFDPTLDDIELVTDVETFRADGSSARFAVASAEGAYRTTLGVNVEDDEFLLHIAGREVGEGTVGWRFPSVGWNLRRSPELAQEWLASTLSSRVDITNPPRQYPPDTIETIIEGYTERLSRTEWTVRANLSLAAPSRVGKLASASAVTDDEFVGHLDADSMELLIAVDADDATWRPHCIPDSITTATHADSFPVDLVVDGERVTLTASSATTPAFVAAGVVDHDDNASVTPGLPAGLAEGDLLLIFAAIRNSGTGTVDTPAGYTRIDAFPVERNVAVFAKYASSSESTPTVSFTSGVAGATTSAQCAAFRDVSIVVQDATAQLNGSAQDIAFPAADVPYDNCVVLYLGWKQDDWTSVAPISGATEIGEPDSTAGDDQGLVWDYVIQTAKADIAAGSFVVTGGAAAISRGGVIVLQGMTRSWTVTRSVNTVTKSHAALTSITLHPHFALQLGM
jgi:hypothetical protein